MTKVGVKACPNAEISRTICELLEWKRANGGLTMSAGNCWNDCSSKAGCDFRGAAFGPARSAPGVSKLVCDGACGDAGCRQDIDQRGAEFDQQYGSIVAARQLHRSQRISSSPRIL